MFLFFVWEVRDVPHGEAPEESTAQEPGTQHFFDDDSVPELIGLEALRLSGTRGVGFELVLDPVVPQLARELVDVPDVVSQVVEQNVYIPVRGGGGGRPKITLGFGGGLQGLRPGQGSTLHASAPMVEYFSPALAASQSPAPVMEFLSSTPAVSLLPDPVVEYFPPAPAVFPSHVPVVEYISPAPAEVQAPAPVVENNSPARAVSQSPAPVIDYFSPSPAVLQATAPVVEYLAPAPVVVQSPAPVVEYISPSTAVEGHQGFLPEQNSTASVAQQLVDTLQGLLPRQGSQRNVEQLVDIPVPGEGPDYGDHSGLHPGQGSTSRRGARARGGGAQRSVPGQGTASRGRQFVGQVLVVPDAAGRDGWIESLSAQAELNLATTLASRRYTGGASSLELTCGSLSGSFPPAGGKLSTWWKGRV